MPAASLDWQRHNNDKNVYICHTFMAYACVNMCLELAVDMLQEVAPRELGKVDMYWASDVSR